MVLVALMEVILNYPINFNHGLNSCSIVFSRKINVCVGFTHRRGGKKSEGLTL